MYLAPSSRGHRTGRWGALSNHTLIDVVVRHAVRACCPFRTSREIATADAPRPAHGSCRYICTRFRSSAVFCRHRSPVARLVGRHRKRGLESGATTTINRALSQSPYPASHLSLPPYAFISLLCIWCARCCSPPRVAQPTRTVGFRPPVFMIESRASCRPPYVARLLTIYDAPPPQCHPCFAISLLLVCFAHRIGTTRPPPFSAGDTVPLIFVVAIIASAGSPCLLPAPLGLP